MGVASETVGSCTLLIWMWPGGGKAAGWALKGLVKGTGWTVKTIRGLGDVTKVTTKYGDDVLQSAKDACKLLSFSGDTQILMGDGSHKAIKDVAPGDVVWAVDPETAEAGPQQGDQHLAA